MRSCKYSKVSEAKNKRTKLLYLYNFCKFCFFKNQIEVPLYSVKMEIAYCISITFKFQKNNTRNDTFAQERAMDLLLSYQVKLGKNHKNNSIISWNLTRHSNQHNSNYKKIPLHIK